MAVIIIIAIVGGWVGAWLLRRRYLARKEREYELRPPGAPWAPSNVRAKDNSPYGDGVVDGVGSKKEARNSVLSKGKGRIMSQEVYTQEPFGADMFLEKPKRKWTVSERT
jgi:hypothetical protein